MSKNPYIKSCISYSGGKYKLLPQILPLFPQKKFRVFIDPFCGGCNIAQNISADRYICCDTIKPLMDLFKYLHSGNIQTFVEDVDKVIAHFHLSKENQDGYLALRDLYNQHNPFGNNLEVDEEVLFFTLICYCFNNQIRFNKNGEFNMPFGKNRSSFNEQLRKNLLAWVEKIQSIHISFTTKDYKDTFNSCIWYLTEQDFVYLDPPYLAGSIATYNENGGWTKEDERILLSYCTMLNQKGIPFALSNVLEHKGEKNELLIEWAKDYNVHYLNYSYQNCNYHKKDKNEKTVEVLITNY